MYIRIPKQKQFCLVYIFFIKDAYEVQLDEDRADVAQEVFTKYLTKDVSIRTFKFFLFLLLAKT